MAAAGHAYGMARATPGIKLFQTGRLAILLGAYLLTIA